VPLRGIGLRQPVAAAGAAGGGGGWPAAAGPRVAEPDRSPG